MMEVHSNDLCLSCDVVELDSLYLPHSLAFSDTIIK